MEKVQQQLLDLTNKFLKDYFEINAQNGEKSEGYLFNYDFIETLLETDFVKAQIAHPDHHYGYGALISMGFEQTLVQKFFNAKIQPVIEDVENVIDKMNVSEFDDYKAYNLQVRDEILNEDDLDIVWPENGDMSKLKVHKVKRDFKYTYKTFLISNSRSGYEALVKATYKEGEFEHIKVYSVNDDKYPYLEIDKKYRSMTSDEYTVQGKINDYSKIKSINSFFITLSQVLYDLKP